MLQEVSFVCIDHKVFKVLNESSIVVVQCNDGLESFVKCLAFNQKVLLLLFKAVFFRRIWDIVCNAVNDSLSLESALGNSDKLASQ